MTESFADDRSALKQLALLNRIALLAVQDIDASQSMLQRIVETLQQEFDWEFVACVVIDKSTHEFVCQAVSSTIPSEVKLGYRRALGTGVVGDCVQSKQTIDLDDTRDYPGFVDTLGATRSELCVPVMHNNEVLAVLNAESLHVGSFRGQRRMLETIAAQIAGVIYAANLYSDLQETHAQLQQAYRAMENISQQDGLTGIANRRRFDAWMMEHLANDEPLSLLMIDIDHFKSYNDGYGHLGGDTCLKQVAELLNYVLADANARLARYGGEEFAVILPATTLRDAYAIGERLRLAVQARAFEHRYSGGKIVTLSIGVASSGRDARKNSQQLILHADHALYEAKRRGRNRVEIHPA